MLTVKSIINSKYLLILSAIVCLGISAASRIVHGMQNRDYELLDDDGTTHTVSLYREYAFLCPYNSGLLPYEDAMMITRPSQYYSAYYTQWDEVWKAPFVGRWSVKGDTVRFFELSGIYNIYEDMQYIDTSFIKLPTCELAIQDDYINLPDNVSIGFVRNFGDEIQLVSYQYYVSGARKKIPPMYYIPSTKNGLSNNLSSENILKMRKGGKAPYYPWEMVAADWRRGRFKVVRKEFSRDSVPMIVTLEKDRLRYSVVNPPYYRPGSEFRFYREEELPGLNAWMDSVRVGESYVFELSRPEYPADSIARFAPLQTVPDSIYAADGEAYGYFFAKRIKD